MELYELLQIQLLDLCSCLRIAAWWLILAEIPAYYALSYASTEQKWKNSSLSIAIV